MLVMLLYANTFLDMLKVDLISIVNFVLLSENKLFSVFSNLVDTLIFTSACKLSICSHPLT